MGMMIFEHGIEVVVGRRQFHHAKKFIKRSKRRISLERDQAGNKDSHEIRVIGKSRGWYFEAARCIGYVPADVADKLFDAGLDDKVTARLQLIYTEGREFMSIRFDLLGPKDEYEKFHSRKTSRGAYY